MLKKDLQKLGLNQKESIVYLSLLELGEVLLEDVVKKSGVKRTTLYDVINSLKEKGLVGTSRRKKRVIYFAQDPRILERKIDEQKKTIKDVMPELLSLVNTIEKKPKVRYYEGEEGIKEVYMDTLEYENQEMLGWVSGEALRVFDEKFLHEYYLPERIKRKIWVRAIAPDVKNMQDFKNMDDKFIRKTKLISAEKFPFNVEINLYGGKNIAIMSFKENFGMVIESKDFYITLKSIFESQWSLLAE